MKDRRIKDFHFCYKCLFEGDPKAHEEALALVKRRKVLKFILKKDEVKQDDSFNSQLAQDLAIPKKELKAVIGALQKEKILFHRPHFEEHIWKVTKSARKLQTINHRYFNPEFTKMTPKCSGTVSSCDSELLSDSKAGHDSDTDFTEVDREIPHFTKCWRTYRRFQLKIYSHIGQYV